MVQEKISVIIPVYNSEKYLPECVDSVLANRYSDLEILLIDDGSMDGSGRICDTYAEKDRRVKAFHKSNGGVSSARNYGIRKATGEWTAFVDSDDRVEPDYFEVLYREGKGADLSVCPLVGEDGDGRKQKEDDRLPESFRICFSDQTEKNKKCFLQMYEKFYLMGPVNKLFRKKMLDEYHIFFPEDTSYGEDLLFTAKYLKHADAVSYTAKTYYHYISREHSLSKRYRADLFENGLRLNRALLSVFEEKGYATAASLNFIYRRIFDDAYNHIFMMGNEACALKPAEKRGEIREIVRNPYVREAFVKAEISDYPGRIRLLMRHRMVWPLYFYGRRRHRV